MSAGQKIRNLAIKIEKLHENDSWKDFCEKYNRMVDFLKEKFQDKQNKQEYMIAKDGTLQTFCHYRPFSTIKIGSASCSECDHNKGINYVENYVYCDYKNKIQLYEQAIQEIIQQKDEDLNFIKTECIKCGKRRDRLFEAAKQQKPKISDHIIEWLKKLAIGYYNESLLTEYTQIRAKNLLKQLGIEE